MRRLLLAAGLLLATVVPLHAQQMGKTNAGYPACATRAALDEFTDLLEAGDKEAAGKYLADRSHRCVILNANLKVYVGDDKGLGHIKIRLAGETLWMYTLTEAVTLVP